MSRLKKKVAKKKVAKKRVVRRAAKPITEIERRFAYHEAGPFGRANMDNLRNRCRLLAKQINSAVPDNRERAIALTKLEEVMFWANAGISRPYAEGDK